MIGETPGIGMQAGRMLSGWSRRELDLIFNFDGLEPPGKVRWDDHRFPLEYLADFWTRYNASIGDGDWVALFVENHDNPRIVSKVCPEAANDPDLRRIVAKLIATMQLTMRGTPFLFQGQELGRINEPFVSRADLRDVESLNRLDALVTEGVSLQRHGRRSWLGRGITRGRLCVGQRLRMTRARGYRDTSVRQGSPSRRNVSTGTRCGCITASC